MVGKYTDLHDAYKSVQEALIHGGIPNDAGVEIEWIASDQFTDQEAAGRLLGGLRRAAGARRIRRCAASRA